MLVQRLGHLVRLTPDEQASLRLLEGQRRSYRRGSQILCQGEPASELFIVRDGWLHSSVVLGSGGRQILRFHFRSDLVGGACLAFRESPETVTAVTDVTVSQFSRERIGDLFENHPRIGALLFAISVEERVSLTDRLASIGRTSARARVSALLCELYQRMRLLGLIADGGMQLPLTQEEIGDATGLTAVHVNRMMRALAEDGLIARNGSQVRVLDETRLCAEAQFADRSEADGDWLPRPR